MALKDTGSTGGAGLGVSFPRMISRLHRVRYPLRERTRRVGRPVYRRLNLAILGGIVGVVVFSQMANVPRDQNGGISFLGYRLPSVCLYRAVFGHPCPGCGISRSVIAAMQLDWQASVALHPSGLYVCMYLLCQATARVILAWVKPRCQVWVLDVVVSTVALLAAIWLPLVVSE